MRSYLSLIPISAKVHRRQSRMTLLCIIFCGIPCHGDFQHGGYAGAVRDHAHKGNARELAYPDP